MKIVHIVSITLFILGTVFAQERTFHLKSGDTVTGAVKTETDSTYDVKTPFGVITINKEEIKRVQRKEKPKKYLSVGFLDHKTGMSLIGYAQTLKQTEKHEFFVGGGTLIAMFTASAGWKYFFYDGYIQAYSVLSIQGVSGMGGGFIAPVISLGIEKRLYKKWFINLGGNSTIRPHPDKAFEFVTFPAININKRY